MVRYMVFFVLHLLSFSLSFIGVVFATVIIGLNPVLLCFLVAVDVAEGDLLDLCFFEVF